LLNGEQILRRLPFDMRRALSFLGQYPAARKRLTAHCARLLASMFFLRSPGRDNILCGDLLHRNFEIKIEQRIRIPN
jgi:hypothetical protein